MSLDAASRDTVAEMWKTSMATPFPPRLYEALVGLDISLLDGFVADCVTTWLDTGSLPAGGSAILRECIEAADDVLPRLELPDELEFVFRLREVASAVLTAQPQQDAPA